MSLKKSKLSELKFILKKMVSPESAARMKRRIKASIRKDNFIGIASNKFHQAAAKLY